LIFDINFYYIHHNSKFLLVANEISLLSDFNVELNKCSDIELKIEEISVTNDLQRFEIIMSNLRLKESEKLKFMRFKDFVTLRKKVFSEGSDEIEKKRFEVLEKEFERHERRISYCLKDDLTRDFRILKMREIRDSVGNKMPYPYINSIIIK